MCNSRQVLSEVFVVRDDKGLIKSPNRGMNLRYPPSTTRHSPVMNEASSEARKTTALATYSGAACLLSMHESANAFLPSSILIF